MNGFTATTDSMTQWANDNFGNTPLGDRRRTSRLIKLVEAMTRRPGSSLPKLSENCYDAKAIYRLLKHKSMKPDVLQVCHRIKVAKEIDEAQNDVLLIEDGTELAFKTTEDIPGLGPVGNGGKYRQGFLLQSVLAVETFPSKAKEQRQGNTARPPVRIIGLVDQQSYVRPPKLKEKRRRRNTNDFLETDLWRNSLKRLPSFSADLKRVIRVCDRAADIYEVIKETQERGLNYVIRGWHNRMVEDEVDQSGKPIRIFEHIEDVEAKASVQVYLRGREGKKARTANLSISCSKVSLRAPSRPGIKYGELPPLQQTVVRVWEPDTENDDSEKIEWMLLTDLSVDTADELRRIVEIYATRWTIEEYHKALKSGLNAERLQLESAEGLIAAVAIMSIVALRLIDLKERLRIIPDFPAADSGLSELELLVLSHQTKRELKTVRCVGLAVGRLGGHLNRKSDGMPGILTLWRGMTELIQLVEGAKIGLQLTRS